MARCRVARAGARAWARFVALACAGAVLWSRPAVADGPASPDDIRGIQEPASRGSSPARNVANAMMWPFRAVVDLLFLTTGVAGGLLQNEQIVPRVRGFFFTSGGGLGVFPPLFFGTGTNANVGVRVITTVGPYAATLRAGYGGPDANVVEGRMRYGLFPSFPSVVSLEALHDWRPNLGYLGLGQTPATDPRNAFRNGPAVGVFDERRGRVVL